MSTPTTAAFLAEDITAWRGLDVLDPDGDKLGKLEELWYDGETDAPTFISVKSGLVSKHLTLVPLQGATVGPDFVRVQHGKKRLKDAPSFEPDTELSVQDEMDTFDFFGMTYVPGTNGARRLARR